MNKEDWGYDPDWGANCLRLGPKVLGLYDPSRPLCDVCLELAESKKEISTQPNVLHIQRRIFI